MNWAKNKFLAGLAAAMVVGCGALGYLLWSSASQYDEANNSFIKQAARLKQLQTQPLYPEQSNLDKVEQQRLDTVQAGAAFQLQLKPMAIALEPVSPEEFADKLRATVSDVVQKADAAKIKLPNKFYLGFNDYQGKLPSKEAAPVLYRQLKAVEIAAKTLIDNRVAAIADIQRDPLPEEITDKPAASAPQPASARNPAAAGNKPAATSNPAALFAAFPFQIQFTADQEPLQNVLNALSSNRAPFFVIRSLSIKNSGSKAITKDSVAPPPAFATPTPPPVAATGTGSSAAPATSGSVESLHFILGTERLNVTMRIDMVVFASPDGK